MNGRSGARARFFLLCIALIWVTHAITYFAHEYAHSGTAWLLGYKSNPLALDYGRLSVSNVLFLGQVDENVDYRAIFAQGQGRAAALIAFAGMGIGNGLLYLLSRLVLRRDPVRRRTWLYLGTFWFCLMNVGNFYDYVPIRTFASHGDIAHIQQGLNLSPWMTVIVLGYPIAWILWHFFARILPETLRIISPDSRFGQTALVLTCAFLIFGYYGASGYFGYGEVSHVLSGISMLAAPGVAAACWPSRQLRDL